MQKQEMFKLYVDECNDDVLAAYKNAKSGILTDETGSKYILLPITQLQY